MRPQSPYVILMSLLMAVGLIGGLNAAATAAEDEQPKSAPASFDLAAGDKPAGEGEAGPRSVVVKPDDPDKVDARFYETLMEDRPDDYSVRFVLQPVHDDSHNRDFLWARSGVPLDPKGRKDGVEHIRRSPWAHGAKHTIPWKQDARHGEERIYHWTPDHKRVLKTVVPWVEGRIHGEKKSFYPDGKVRSVTRYVKGDPVGESVTYMPDGKVVRRVRFKGGERHGETVDSFAGTDRPRRIVPYRKGKVHGLVREFHENGKTKREMLFRDNVLHGEEKHYDADGKLERTRYWIEGELVTEGVFKDKYKP